MFTIRKSEERGHVNYGWLDSYHTFSFANYYEPQHMSFRSLRVINQDQIVGGKGFGTHPHRDMEIISYVLEGELAHKDSMGNGSVIRYGDVQRMSAGTGVMHSEFNHSADKLVHFLQIWIEPNVSEIPPSYEQKSIPMQKKQGKLCLVASPDGAGNSVKIAAEAKMYAGLFNGPQSAQLTLNPHAKAYAHLITGSLNINGQDLCAGDALLVENEKQLDISNGKEAEVLIFELSH